MQAISLTQIETARERIAGTIRSTPVVASPSLTEALGVPVSLKLEHQQITGSFKLRGASNAVLRLSNGLLVRDVEFGGEA